MPDPSPPEPEEQPCEQCGRYTAQRLGHWLCESCYQARGSCCTEFEEEDEDEDEKDGD